MWMRARCGGGNVRVSLALGPERGIFVDGREHADEIIAVDNAKERAGFYLVEDRAVGEFGPEQRALLALHGAAVLVRRANLGEMGGCRWLDAHYAEN